MEEISATVGSAQGLHARPAATFVRAVAASGVPVTLVAGDRTVDAASLLAVLTLGVSHGDTVTLRTADAADLPRLESLADLLASELDR